MPNTFSQIYLHIVFAVKFRNSLIQPLWEERLYQYITGIIRNKGQKLLAINGTANHIHLLIGMKPSCCLSDLVREIKKSSNEFIRDNKLSNNSFQWQEGFGAFSTGHSQLDSVIKYILKQKEHHRKLSFKEEYKAFLTKYCIEFQDQYLFEWFD